METRYSAKITLREKEIQGEQNLSSQKIATLESKIKEQEAMIQYLNKKSDDATEQVKDIACQALQSSSERLQNYDKGGNQRSEIRGLRSEG